MFGAHTENSDLLAAGSAAVVSPCLPPSSRRRLKLQCSGLSWGARLRRNPHPQAQFIQSFLFNCASFAAMNARISADMSSSARVEARRCSGTFLHSIKRASAGRSSGEWSDDARADASLKWAEHPNLRKRPSAPSKGRGPVQRAIRRAFAASDTEVRRRRGRRKSMPFGVYSRTLRTICDPVERVRGCGGCATAGPALWAGRPAPCRPTFGARARRAQLSKCPSENILNPLNRL